MEDSQLIIHALEARKNSYAPYSNYCVGAALETVDGEVYYGNNIENASYGATVCAERTAIFNAVSNGKTKFKAIAIVGGARDENQILKDYAYPCGICRQVMREFVSPSEFTVIVAKSADDYRKYTLEELLPESFGPEHLDNQ